MAVNVEDVTIRIHVTRQTVRLEWRRPGAHRYRRRTMLREPGRSIESELRDCAEIVAWLEAGSLGSPPR